MTFRHKRHLNYICASAYVCGSTISTYVTDVPNSLCPNCGNRMSRKLTYLTQEPVGTTGTGFVKEALKYMVMDDLVVKPLSIYFNAKDVGSLQEKVVNLGMEEALKLLKASFESKTVLTSVFLSSAKQKRASCVELAENKLLDMRELIGLSCALLINLTTPS
ncbi:hypothetical protein H5410_033673 [Solanum commersonii]|uniref:Uncharacterized protein n=1 Tax=Solanum commersonii TaxID=4109 RepID=A0A9J5YRA5_SOLCO|nr:hypothetical protein H5410_033673 [Solanum commersonii]